MFSTTGGEGREGVFLQLINQNENEKWKQLPSHLLFAAK